MNRLTLPVAALALTAAFVPTAHASSVEVYGQKCGFSGFSNPFAPHLMGAEVDGGPMTFRDSADPAAVVSARLVCTIQVDAPTHDGPDAAVLRSLTAPVAAVAGAVEVDAPAASNLYLCTQVDFADGTTLYWDTPYDGSSSWSTDPASSCAWAVSPGSPPEEPIDPNWVDTVVCPALAVVSPPQGDVEGAWDCPPYAR